MVYVAALSFASTPRSYQCPEEPITEFMYCYRQFLSYMEAETLLGGHVRVSIAVYTPINIATIGDCRLLICKLLLLKKKKNHQIGFAVVIDLQVQQIPANESESPGQHALWHQYYYVSLEARGRHHGAEYTTLLTTFMALRHWACCTYTKHFRHDAL